MRAYYQTTKKIRSLLPASGAGSSAYLMSLDPNGEANQVAMTLFAATSKPSDSGSATVLCNNTATVAGGAKTVASVGAASPNDCPAGTYGQGTINIMCHYW